MKSEFPHLEHILDIETWQTLQDSLSLVTGLAIITVDYKGVPLTRHSSCRPFCDYVRNQLSLGKLCQKCDSRGGLEAVRMSQPYTYICHCKIIDVAIPIIVDNQYIGAIMAGQVKLMGPQETYSLEQIVSSSTRRILDMPGIKEYYDSIPHMSYADLQVRIRMLFDLCNYVVKEAMNKNVILEMYEKISAEKPLIAKTHSPGTIKRIRQELGNALTNVYIESSSQDSSMCTNALLQPVFNYLFEHRNEILPQKKAAELCHISSGYFSRLFIQETGERYTEFCARQKVEWAKKLLDRTDLSISQISDELGYNEPSYFIKVFRKYEGISPLAYRKLPEKA